MDCLIIINDWFLWLILFGFCIKLIFVRNDFLKIYRNLQNLCVQKDKYREKKKKERARIFQTQKLIKRQRERESMERTEYIVRSKVTYPNRHCSPCCFSKWPACYPPHWHVLWQGADRAPSIQWWEPLVDFVIECTRAITQLYRYIRLGDTGRSLLF